MAKFTEDEIEQLSYHRYVDKVSEDVIKFSDEFKEMFIREYLDGKKPTEIFLRAGFDTDVLGAKRIERCSARWRKAYEDGMLLAEDRKRKRAGLIKKLETANNTIETQMAEIEQLKRQIERLEQTKQNGFSILS